MTVEYKDVIRVHDTESNLVSSVLRNKQLGKGTDGQNRLVLKDGTGTPFYWTADGYSPTYNNIYIGEYLYHDGDPDTYLRFGTNAFEIVTGSKTWINSTETGILHLDEEVMIGDYTFPYTGGNPGQALVISGTNELEWSDIQTDYSGVTGTSTYQRIVHTTYGGLALCLKNTGATGIEYSEIVRCTTGTTDSIELCPANSNHWYGVAFEDIPVGICGYVVVKGKTPVKFDFGGSTEGDYFEISDTIAGSAKSVSIASIDYDKKIGFVMDTHGSYLNSACLL